MNQCGCDVTWFDDGYFVLTFDLNDPLMIGGIDSEANIGPSAAFAPNVQILLSVPVC